MEKHITIKKPEDLHRGLDYNALRLEGIHHVQTLSGSIWTDYNEHDPGVTLLEHLCYALTDLSYRANFDTEDLLYATGNKIGQEPENTFFDAVDILPTAPVSVTDYRRLIIDRIQDIRNAWVEPVIDPVNGYRGLLRIRLQLAEDIVRTARREDVIGQVRELIMANRNLCEDLHEIIILKTERLNISALIHIEADAFGEKVQANILHTLGQLLNPGIRFYGREQLIAEGWPMEKVFDGPAPFHGFIKTADLRPLPGSTHVSTLREVIAQVPGVKLVNDLKVWKDGRRIMGDEIIPGPDSALSFDLSLAGSAGRDGGINLIRNGVQVEVNNRHTRQFLNTLAAKAKRGFQLKLDLSSPKPVSEVSIDQIGQYYSIQRLFPAVYGIGAEGLPPTADRARRAKALQLKGYLLIFEQFLSDFLAQLVHVRTLFSIADTTESGRMDSDGNLKHARTYFTDFPENIPGVLDLYRHELGKNTPASEIIAVIKEELEEITRVSDPADERRNRYLDHLLARFGEVFSGDNLKLMDHGTNEDLAEELIRGKAAFLRNYKEVSRDRGKAFDYTQPAWEVDNISGFKKRVALLLNLNKYHEPRSKDEVEKFKHYNRPLFSVGDLPSLNLGKSEQASKGPRLPLRTMLRQGTQKKNYRIAKKSEGYELVFHELKNRLSSPSAADSRSASKGTGDDKDVLMTGSYADCEKVRNGLAQRFRQINDLGEGFFLIENILLRPAADSGAPLLLKVDLIGDDLPESISLRSPKMVDDRARRELSQEILYDTARRANWSIIGYEGTSRIVLTRNGRPLLVSDPQPDRKTAEAIIDQLISFFLELRATDPAQLENYLSVDLAKEEKHTLDADFYSLRLSIIAPDWPALFQEHDFRLLFQQVVAANVPAHLAVDYYWLTPQEMQLFEGGFQHWLEALRLGNLPELDKYSQKILELLQIIPPTGTEGDAGTDFRKMPDGLLRKLGRKFGFSYMFSDDDFNIFTNLGPKIASVLPDYQAASWAQLATIDPKELKEGLLNEGITVSESEISNWQYQADLAQRGRWSELLTLQRRVMAGEDVAPNPKPALTKVEKSVKALLRRPAELLEKIRSWVIRLPDDYPVPTVLLDFLLESAGDGFLMKETSLDLFTGITPYYAKALRKSGVSNWEQLLKVRKKALIQLDENSQPAPDWNLVRQEAALALAGDWATLFRLQAHADGANGPARRLAEERREELLAPTPPGGNRPLVQLLREWRRAGKPFNPPQNAGASVLMTLEYHNLLPPDDLSIFAGTGKKTESVLRAAGINSWHALAAADKETLASILPKRPGITATDLASALSEQAVLATSQKWEALVRWQKGPMTGSETHPETPLEREIDGWITLNGRPGN